MNDNIRYNSNFFPTCNTPSFSVSNTSIGWVIGTGIEYGVTANWTIEGEALYANLGSINGTWLSPGSATFPAGAVYGARFDTSVAVIRAGVNYKFDWFTSPGLGDCQILSAGLGFFELSSNLGTQPINRHIS